MYVVPYGTIVESSPLSMSHIISKLDIRLVAFAQINNHLNVWPL